MLLFLRRGPAGATVVTAVAAVVALLSISCTELAEPEPELQMIGQPIAGGEIDGQRVSVVGIKAISGMSGGLCSGTLIAPNLVLTAQHCVASVATEWVQCGVSSFGSVFEADNLDFTTDTAMSPTPGPYLGVEVHVPENDRDFCGNDIALVILDSNVDPSEAAPLIPRVDEPTLPGELYTAVGYGHTGSGQDFGIRRSIGNRSAVCVHDCPPWVQAAETEWLGDSGVCQGDSGGPALDSQERVIGVASRGPDGCAATTYSSVEAWSDWIREVGDHAAELGGYQPAPWVTLGNSDPALLDADDDNQRWEFDNCPEIANANQADADGDGIGDICDPIDGMDRGGSCEICNGCVSDADCSSGRCARVGDLNLCTQACDDGCPGNSACFQVPNATGDLESVCVNADAPEQGLCYDTYVCEGSSDGGGTGNLDGLSIGEPESGCSQTGRVRARLPSAFGLFGTLATFLAVVRIRRRSRQTRSSQRPSARTL